MVLSARSVMTNKQVQTYQTQAPSCFLEVEEALNNPNYAQQLAQWVQENSRHALAPIVYATVLPANCMKFSVNLAVIMPAMR